MDTKNDGGPAFPSEGEGHGNPLYHSPGMTLRDWFAGQALAGIIASDTTFATGVAAWRDGWPSTALLLVAKTSYILADAMLAARESGQ